MLERVHIRPELTVFEQMLRQRVERLSTITEERFARPSAVERDPSGGELVVVAEFVTGSRLSELLDVSADAAAVPGVDVALGYLLECLPALSTLHTSNRAVHGLIDPSRTILTPEGQVVFLDLAFGPAVEALQMSPQRLWTDFGLFTSGNGRVHFDPAADVTQAALGALMLVLGRNLRHDEYPDAIPTLLSEVIEVAHIRGTTAFAGGLQRILQRSLPIVGRRAYTSADELLADVRQLVKKEIGLEVCRQALIDFVAQMEEAYASAIVSEAPALDAHRADPVSFEPRVHELDRFLETFEVAAEFDQIDQQSAGDVEHARVDEDEGIDDGEETELTFDQAEPAAPVRQEREEVYDLAALDDFALADSAALSSEFAFEARPAKDEPTPTPIDPIAEFAAAEPMVAEPIAAEPIAEPEYVAPAPSVEDVAAEEELQTAAPQQEPAPFVSKEEAAAESAESESDSHQESGSSRRRKRQQLKSARARKDKLRSTTDQKEKAPTPPPPTTPKPASPSGWLVSPQRAAASESLIPPPQPVPIPQAPRPAQAPTLSFSPTPVGPLPQPTYASPSTSSSIYGSPTIVKPPPPPVPVQAPPPSAPAQAPQLKIKTDAPSGFNATRRTYPEPQAVPPPPDRFSTLSLGRSTDVEDAPRAFPWKLAAVAVGVAVVAIIAGRSYLPGRTAVAGELGAPTENTAANTTPPPPKPDAAIPAGKGRVSIQTQPPGIKVLLDRKPIGETPVQIDTTPGRHVLTFQTSGGEVLHSIRVAAGKTVALDLPVFSGWLAVFAPILLDIAEDGRTIGTTEQSRLMLPPGRHELTFSNKELGFSESRTVDIEPGGVRNVTVEPKGTANINASPWAEVWLDGKKLGETPLADTPVPLGLHEFVFKHPQHGERKVSATIRANATTQISTDFTK